MPGSSGTERPAASASGVLLALAGAMTFSGKAIIVKLAYRYGVDAVTLLMLRMLFALPLFADDGLVGRAAADQPRARDWLGVLGLGSPASTSPASRLSRAALHHRSL